MWCPGKPFTTASCYVISWMVWGIVVVLEYRTLFVLPQASMAKRPELDVAQNYMPEGYLVGGIAPPVWAGDTIKGSRIAGGIGTVP